jgi:hypothetical protein
LSGVVLQIRCFGAASLPKNPQFLAKLIVGNRGRSAKQKNSTDAWNRSWGLKFPGSIDSRPIKVQK